jgi:creatinine amidohydrolase
VPKVRYHEMLPREILERRASCPVAFVGIGTLEWHAKHAAVGLDGLKAERLCELAAELSGGFSFPTLWYGEPRSVQHMDADQEDTPAIRHALGLRPRARAVPADADAEIVRFQSLVRRLMLQLYETEMLIVCVLCGHYPLYHWAAPIGEELNAERGDAMTLVGTEVDFAGPVVDGVELAGTDHAGIWETSYLWHLRPECVDMSVYEKRDDDRLIGVIGQDPRGHASPELGERAADAIVAGMVARSLAALQQLAS